MPHSKLKSESFQNLGGINVKASPYLTGPQEYLNLVNFDFQTPGSLTKRWGSTQYMTQSYTGQIYSLYEYNQLGGASYMLLGVSGGLWAGGTNGQLGGVSFSYAVSGATNFLSIGGIDFIHNGTTAVPEAASVYGIFVDGIANPIRPGNTAGSGGYGVISNVQNTNNLSTVTINNWMFSADGRMFFKYDGVTTSFYGVPPAFPSLYETNNTTYNGLTTSVLLNGYDYRIGFAFVNRRGFEGPMSVGLAIQSGLNATGGTWGFKGTTFSLAVPFGYDIDKIKYYLSYSTGTSSTVGIYPTTALDAFNRTYYSAGSATVGSGATVGHINLGVQWNRSSGLDFPTWVPTGYQFKGMTYETTLGASTFVTASQTYFAPKYLEIYNNQLMMAGFTGIPSTVWYSEIGEPEAVGAENFFEARTNDGDVITGLKAFASNLMIFKLNSYHQLSGQDPQNFSLRQISDQYGCLNHRSIVVYDDYLLFLDRTGIIKFNGANQETVSTKIQGVFDVMNVSAAKDTACMVLDKKRNQIMCAIPIDGATMNNVTVVYDYLVNAWTKYEGFNPSLFLVGQGKLASKTVFYGGYTGNIYNIGASYFGDNGTGFTCLLKTRYMSEMGQSVEKQFRRLYLNVDEVTGSTSSFSIKLYPNYGSTVGFTATMYANPFQSRIDFGLSAKSLAFELSNNSVSDSVKLHGYVLEYRMQRNV